MKYFFLLLTSILFSPSLLASHSPDDFDHHTWFNAAREINTKVLLKMAEKADQSPLTFTDNDGNTALHLISQNIDKTQKLIEKLFLDGKDSGNITKLITILTKDCINIQNNNGDTPLHLLLLNYLESNYHDYHLLIKQIIVIFINNGADLKIKNNKHQTAYDIPNPNSLPGTDGTNISSFISSLVYKRSVFYKTLQIPKVIFYFILASLTGFLGFLTILFIIPLVYMLFHPLVSICILFVFILLIYFAQKYISTNNHPLTKTPAAKSKNLFTSSTPTPLKTRPFWFIIFFLLVLLATLYFILKK